MMKFAGWFAGMCVSLAIVKGVPVTDLTADFFIGMAGGACGAFAGMAAS